MFNQLFPVRTVQRRAVSPRVPTTVRDGVFRLIHETRNPKSGTHRH